MSHRFSHVAVVLGGALLGCAARTPEPSSRAAGAARAPAFPLLEDPTVRGTRFVPETLHEVHSWGGEAAGGSRATVAGVRMLLAGEALLTAVDRLPSGPSAVVAVPERMGGGFLFVLGPQVWRSDTWLGPVHPLLRSIGPIGDVMVGLDRAYLVLPGGPLAAFDPQTGSGQDLGSLPPSPRLGRVAAVDAWRAVAIADLRGAMVTLDAGASWRSLPLAAEPTDALAAAGSLFVRGYDPARRPQWWEVGRDGHPLRLASAPVAAPAAPGDLSAVRFAGPLGESPLAAAIEDGWPLADRTALVARDGSLARVRLDDGTVTQTAADAFPLRPARCRAVSLQTPRERSAFGFVCGEPHGKTAIYRWDPERSGLADVRTFDAPRQVLAFGNGALAVRGECAPQARDTPTDGDDDRAWCTMTPDGRWTERHFRGDRVDRARLVVLSDGRIALVRPPQGELATARLTLADGIAAEHMALRFPLLHDSVTRALLNGVWLDGFEERRPGVLSGWVDAAGAIVGVEITIDGSVRVGEYIRDGGAPFASGRWAFGWTASRRAFETTDGGMTWTKLEVPEPAAPVGTVPERACGPAGCIAAGWLKIGWTNPGAPPPAAPLPAPPFLPSPPSRSPPPIRLACQRQRTELVVASGAAPRVSSTQPTQIAPGAALPAFCGRPPALRPVDAPAVVLDVGDGAGWPRKSAPVAEIGAWGPPAGEWDRLGRWEVRWRPLWGSCATASGPAPWPTIDAATRALSRSGGGASVATLLPGDDTGQALLALRRSAGYDLTVLEDGRAPRALRRADGEAFADVEGAMEASGEWYVATAQSPAEVPATVLWRVDGDTAREVARVPRAGGETRAPARVARRVDARSIGLVVDGRPDARQSARLWVTSVDPETGEVGVPEPLAPLDAPGESIAPCTGDDDGWRVELPYGGAVDVELGIGAPLPVSSNYVTMRLSSARACIERVALFASDDVLSPVVAATPGAPVHPALGGRTLDVHVLSPKARTLLRCRVP